MTKQKEDGIIRLPPRQKKRLRVSPGDRLRLTTHDNRKLSVTVANVHADDLVSDNKAAWVTQDVFDLIVGNPTDYNEVTLGCDPEFLFLDAKRKVLPANYWLPMRGTVGSDGPLAEFRPSPARHETEVIENLRKLIRGLPPMLQRQFGSRKLITAEGHSCWDNLALGFHIHLGAPRELITYAAPGSKEFVRSLVSGLDFFVGIPAMLLENTNTRRLGNGEYGKPGDFRITNRTIEYRTPGGFHLRHPEYAAGIMGLALCFAKEALEKAREESSGWRELKQIANYHWMKDKFDLPAKKNIKWALLEPTKKIAVNYLPQLVKNLKNLKYFDEHSDSIRTYFRLMLGKKQYGSNLLQNW